jgi:DUF1365 family protein
MATLKPSVVTARVGHTRRAPVRNSFGYKVDYVLLDETLLRPGAGTRLFSFGRRNLISLHPGDHGFAGEGGVDWVRRIAAEAGLSDVAEVSLLTHPRYWGYVFNPVSFWFMTARNGDLSAVLAEVHNTFGDRHCYLCRAAGGGPIRPDSWIEAEKQFHVSPFFEIEGRYRFRFALDDQRVAVWIDYDNGNGGGLHTALLGKRRPLSDAQLVLALLRRPLGAAKTTALIYWQALKLSLKGVRYRPRPMPPRERIS